MCNECCVHFCPVLSPIPKTPDLEVSRGLPSFSDRGDAGKQKQPRSCYHKVHMLLIRQPLVTFFSVA